MGPISLYRQQTQQMATKMQLQQQVMDKKIFWPCLILGEIPQ